MYRFGSWFYSSNPASHDLVGFYCITQIYPPKAVWLTINSNFPRFDGQNCGYQQDHNKAITIIWMSEKWQC